MTTKAVFSPEEWKVVLERPPVAGGCAREQANYRGTRGVPAFCADPRRKVGAAHREHGQTVNPAEAEVIQQITEALGTSSS